MSNVLEICDGRVTKKLGFGLMRLPHKGPFTDVSQTAEMVDRFLEAGCTYFDTAFVYIGSEDTARKALVSRYPRESFTLATKLFGMLCPTRKAAQDQFQTSLKRTGAGYFDYYLLHSLMEANIQRYDKLDLWSLVQEWKSQGLVRHMGFSFHGTPQLLDRLLREHPEVEFVQLQLNYADWENPRITSRQNYEIARKYGKPIVVMEPVKGGALAKPPKEVQKILEMANPKASPASWAIRFAAGLEGVLTVLSGMSNLEQMQDNLSYMKDFQPLSEEENRVIHEAQRLMGESKTIPCTACRYCTPGCPQGIGIPDIFAAMNRRIGSGQAEEARADYLAVPNGPAKCIRCGKCEAACPQHLPIIQHLQECRQAFEKES